MNTAVVSKIETSQGLSCTGPAPSRIGTQTDLFGAPVREKPAPKEKRLGYLSKTELIDEVRKIFPNARVLPNIKPTANAPIRAWLRRAWLQTSKPNR
jgi:hypothetical protein